MPGLQALNRRIKSVKSTRKVTRAMQMVSASKMRRAQNQAITSRGYASLAWELISELNQNIVIEHPLLSENERATKVGIILISTNKGLVGSLNSNLLGKIREIEKADIEIVKEFVVMGKKMREATSRLRKNVVADFEKKESRTVPEDVYPIAQMISSQYQKGEYKRVYVVYSEFVSTLTQRPMAKVLLPIKAEGINKIRPDGERSDFLFEPDAYSVLNHLLPRILESQIYQAVLESDASEHSARMIMMKNATESAGDLISDLTLTFNQLRQNKITTELSEITAGKLALENK